MSCPPTVHNLIQFAIELCPDRYRIGAVPARASDLWYEYCRSDFYAETKHEYFHWLACAEFLKQR